MFDMNGVGFIDIGKRCYRYIFSARISDSNSWVWGGRTFFFGHRGAKSFAKLHTVKCHGVLTSPTHLVILKWSFRCQFSVSQMYQEQSGENGQTSWNPTRATFYPRTHWLQNDIRPHHVLSILTNKMAVSVEKKIAYFFW